MVMSSVCSSTNLDNESLIFHLFGEDSKIEEMEQAAGGAVACNGAKFDVMSISSVTQQLIDRGFNPFWASAIAKAEGNDEPIDKTDKMQWGVVTPYRHDKHAAPLNLLRFYLPHLPAFDNVDNIVFLDDDIVVQKDVQDLISLPRLPSTALLAGCQHWQWKAGGFETTYHLSVRDSNYIGNHAVVCTEEDKTNPDANCVSSTLEKDISDLSLVIEDNDSAHHFFAGRPLDRQAFNMGLNVLDTKSWIDLGLTERFEKLVDLNFANHLFPSDTLAFGLVLGYFAVGDSFECYDSEISHIVGLAFIPQENLDAADFSVDKIQEEGFALHYNGPTKPWDLDFDHLCANPTAPLQVSTDVWLRHCIDLAVCVCKDTNEEQLGQDSAAVSAAAQRRLQRGNEYVGPLKRNKAPENANAYNVLTKDPKDRGQGNGKAKGKNKRELKVTSRELSNVDNHYPWLHIPKTGSSFINTLFRSACADVPTDLVLEAGKSILIDVSCYLCYIVRTS